MKTIYSPPSVDSLQLQAVSVVPSTGKGDSPEVFLLLKDPANQQLCSTRLKVKDAATSLRIVRALASCKGKSLAALAEVDIKEESANFRRSPKK